jgi:hypothetical protein
VLAAAAFANRRQASIFGRHPILSFVVAPIPVALVSWVGFLFLSFGLWMVAGWVFGDEYSIENRAVRDWPTIVVSVFNGMTLALRFLPPALATTLLCWCANRAGMSWRWMLCASGLIALVAGMLVLQVTLPPESGQGQLVLGLGFPVSQWINLLQFLVPLAIGAGFSWCRRTELC